MNWARIEAIFRKDMRDALRDSRVLTAIIMPLLLGLLYSFMFNQDTPRQKVKVGVVSPSPTLITQAIRKQAPSTVTLTFVTVMNEARLRDQVRREKLDVGLVLPDAFDQAVQAGRSPTLVVVLPAGQASFGGDYVAAVVDRAVQSLTDRPPTAVIVKQQTAPNPGGGSVALEAVGQRKIFVLISIILLLAMVAVYAVPAVLVEETEKKTMDALTLIASTADVITAKAQFGVVLSVVSVPLLLAVTRGQPEKMGALLVAVVLSSVVLVGIGLLFAGIVRTQQQLNTWSGLLLLPLLAPAFTIGLSTPAVVNKVLAFLPTVYTFRLAAEAFAGRTLYPDTWLSYAVLAAWGVGAYGLLWWRLTHQEA